MGDIWINLLTIAFTGAVVFVISVRVAQKRSRQLEVELAQLKDEIKRGFAMDRHITPDLTPITTTLELLEYRTAAMDAKLTKFIPGFIEEVERASRHSDRNKELPRVLGAKLYGTKDNLQLLKGVSPTLERLLNANGVHYFWQIAEWDEVDIAAIDKRLLSFRGRIEQYDWVNQAKRLVRMTDPGESTEAKSGGGKRI